MMEVTGEEGHRDKQMLAFGEAAIRAATIPTMVNAYHIHATPDGRIMVIVGGTVVGTTGIFGGGEVQYRAEALPAASMSKDMAAAVTRALMRELGAEETAVAAAMAAVGIEAYEE